MVPEPQENVPMRSRITIALAVLVWLWILYTLLVVGLFGGAVVLDPDTTARIMSVRNDNAMASSVGLTYHGLGGAALVVVELVLVAGALLLSFRSRGRARVWAPAVLVLWTALWLGNALWLRTVGWDHPSGYGIVAAMVIVLAWAVLRWRPGSEPKRPSAATPL
jgi:hypothetical protein